MDEKLKADGYKTIEALYVFVELATKASERLGFEWFILDVLWGRVW